MEADMKAPASHVDNDVNHEKNHFQHHHHHMQDEGEDRGSMGTSPPPPSADNNAATAAASAPTTTATSSSLFQSIMGLSSASSAPQPPHSTISAAAATTTTSAATTRKLGCISREGQQESSNDPPMSSSSMPGAIPVPGYPPRQQQFSNLNHHSSNHHQALPTSASLSSPPDADEEDPQQQQQPASSRSRSRSNLLDPSESQKGLVVANPISEEISTTKLPQADALHHLQEISSRSQKSTGIRENQEQEKRRTFLQFIGLLTFVILVVVVIVSLVVTNNNKESQSQPTTMSMSSNSPSQSPTSLEDMVLTLLGEEDATIIVSDGESSSPQSKAYAWLMEERDSLPNLSPQRIRQRWGLAVLYYSTNGDSWSDNTGWLNHSLDECLWYTKGDFASKNQFASLYPGYLYGFLEEPTSNCDENGLYQHLWLDTNNLRGILPFKVICKTIPSLKTLSVMRNHLEGGTIGSEIGLLSQLEGLALEMSSSTANNKIPSQIGLLKDTLQILLLTGNDLGGTIPPQLWQLTNLDTLSLSRNPKLQGTLPTIEFGNMKGLRWLTFDDTNLSGTLPTHLGKLTGLELIAIIGTRITGTIPSEIANILPLWNLSLIGNLLTGHLPSQLGSLTLLNNLSFRENLLSGSIPTTYGNMSSLERGLTLMNNALTGVLPTHLGNLTSLRKLGVDGNAHTGSIPSELGELTLLERLELGNNSLSGKVPNELAALQHSLYTMNLKGNVLLSGTIPLGLCTLNGSCSSAAFGGCEVSPGLNFDCSNLLCGCNCSLCSGST